MTVQVVTEDATFRRAVQQSLEVAEGVDVQAHAAGALPPDVVVVDVEAAALSEREVRAMTDSGVTILVAPEIDASVRESGRVLDANAYVRKDDGLFKVIGLVIELASSSR